MSNFQDHTIKCKNKCGNEILFTAAQQLEYQQKVWSPPKQCCACKSKSNLGERSKAAPVAELPKTKEDAVIPASSFKVDGAASGSVAQVATSTGNTSWKSGAKARGGGGAVAVAVAVAAPTSSSFSSSSSPSPPHAHPGPSHRVFWCTRNAKQKSAGFLYGPLDFLLPLLAHWHPDHRGNCDDKLLAMVAIRLGSIEPFLYRGTFPVRESGDIYMKGKGNVQELEAGTIIDPSTFTLREGIHEPSAFKSGPTKNVGGYLFCDKLRRLAQQHPECYILGVQNKEGDMQPFVSESAKDADESPTNILFRGLQEELQMTLSNARRGELAGSFQGPFGLNRNETTGLATKILHVVDIPILHGLGADYTIHIDDSQVLPDQADAAQTQNAAATTQDIQAIVSQTARLSVHDMDIARGG